MGKSGCDGGWANGRGTADVGRARCAFGSAVCSDDRCSWVAQGSEPFVHVTIYEASLLGNEIFGPRTTPQIEGSRSHTT